MSERQTTVRFAESVSPNSTVTLTKDVDQPATVERIDVRIYRGAELDLEVQPYIVRDGTDRLPLIEFRGKDYVDGDGDFFEFPVVESIDSDDTIGVEVTNQDSQYTYDFSVDLVVDREGGAERGVTSFLRRLF